MLPEKPSEENFKNNNSRPQTGRSGTRTNNSKEILSKDTASFSGRSSTYLLRNAMNMVESPNELEV